MTQQAPFTLHARARSLDRLAIVGAGRMGNALAAALAATGVAVEGPLRRGEAPSDDRGAYHAAASIASNFLITLEGVAERLAQSAGLDREPLAQLVRATVANWAQLGAERALTGPIARGDDATVARQRAAIAERLPGELALLDALADATRRLAAGTAVAA